MTVTADLVSAVAIGLATMLARPRPPTLPPVRGGAGRDEPGRPNTSASAGPLQRWRSVWSLAAGLSGLAWVGGPAGAVVGALLGVGAWIGLGRVEAPGVRLARAAVRADLPHLVLLLAATVRGGAAPESGLDLACGALPGPAADRLADLRARLALGVDPAAAWAALAADPELAPLGRCLSRAHDSGASVVDAIERLATELARDRRAAAEDRARTVGVRAAIPLGLCLLPAFLVLGIVPVVAGLVTALLR